MLRRCTPCTSKSTSGPRHSNKYSPTRTYRPFLANAISSVSAASKMLEDAPSGAVSCFGRVGWNAVRAAGCGYVMPGRVNCSTAREYFYSSNTRLRCNILTESSRIDSYMSDQGRGGGKLVRVQADRTKAGR